jgi:hypothetical protein
MVIPYIYSTCWHMKLMFYERQQLPPPLMTNSGSHSLGISSGGGEVHCQDPLCLECRLVSGHLIRLGHSDHFLPSKLASLLRCLELGISLLSTGSLSLPLLKGVLSFKSEFSVRPRGNGPQQNHHHGLRGRSILQPWCGCDGSRCVPMLCLRETGRPEHPSLLEAV